MSHGKFGYAAANTFLGVRADLGDGWKRAVEQVADAVVRPDLVGLMVEPDMNVFGWMPPQLTPGMDNAYRAFQGKEPPFGMAV